MHDIFEVKWILMSNMLINRTIISLLFFFLFRAVHLDAVKEVVFRNGTLRANFFRDIWRVEKVRKRFDATETQLFKEVLREGMEKGVFQIDDLDMTAEIVHYSVKGIETPYIRGHIGANLDDAVRDTYVTRLVLGALGKK